MNLWAAFPYEVQLLIVIEAINTPNTLNPVSTLLDFLILSRDVHDQLVGAPQRGIQVHNDLFLRLFETRFDAAAPRRRFAYRRATLTTDMFADAFKLRCQLLRDIKNGKMWQLLEQDGMTVEQLNLVLWEVYMMLLEDDGKNMEQLEHAEVERWLRSIMLAWAAQDLDEDGWPKETTTLQLATASFAIISDRASVLREPQEVTREIIDTLEPILLGCHRYPHASIPITCLYPNHVHNVPVVPPNSLRTMATMPVTQPCDITYFGHHLTLSPPTLATNVVLIITNRQEQVPLAHPSDLPANRAEADAQGFRGVTQEEWDGLNKLRRTAIGVATPRAGSDHENVASLENPLLGSERWDHVVNRMHAVAYYIRHPTNDSDVSLTQWFASMYTPGMFSGFWLGRIVYPDVRMLQRMQEMHPATLAAVRDTLDDGELGIYTNFFQANFREHITTEPAVGCGEEDMGYGVQNGYFPSEIDPTKNRRMFEIGSEVIVSDPREDVSEWAIKRYHTWQEGMALPKCRPLPALQVANSPDLPEDVEMDFDEEGIPLDEPHFDVIITGETDYRHGAAFWAYDFFGRVRKLDGLVVLVRVSQNPDPNGGQGRWIFSGNMQLPNTIVGTWRTTGSDIHRATAFQAPFVISKLGAGFFSSSA